MKTESRDRKEKKAAAAFVVWLECGNVEALCQTFLKRGQITFSQRGKPRGEKSRGEVGGNSFAPAAGLKPSSGTEERERERETGTAWRGGGGGVQS